MSLVPPGTDGAVEVVVTSLELTAIDDIIAARPVEGATVVTDHPDPACLSERYYREVGADWFWVDRADWSPQQWSEWVGRPGHQLLELREYGEPAGYAELDPQADGSVELAYFQERVACGYIRARWTARPPSPTIEPADCVNSPPRLSGETPAFKGSRFPP